MYRLVVFFFVLTAFVPMAVSHAQNSDPLVTVSIAEDVVKPGDAITVTWEASSHLRRFHHVAIELPDPHWNRTVFTSTNRSGSMSITIPADFYDEATITVYPQKSNNQNYKDAAGKVISASAKVVIDDGVEIKSLTVSPNPVEQGGTITVSWEVTYGDNPVPFLSLTHPSDEDFYAHELNLPPVGSMTLTIPDYYTESFFVSLGGDKIMPQQVDIGITCAFSEYYSEVETCPMSRANVTLTYQYFEGGLMIAWGDFIFVLTYVGSAYGYTQPAADLSGIEVPEGVQLPDTVFSGTWLVFRDRVGFAIGDAGTYSTIMETHPDSSGRHKATGYWFGGPDGVLIYSNPLRLIWETYD